MDTACSVNGQRQTDTLNYEVSTVWEMKPRTAPEETYVNGAGTGHGA